MYYCLSGLHQLKYLKYEHTFSQVSFTVMIAKWHCANQKMSYRGLVNNKHNVQVCDKVFIDK